MHLWAITIVLLSACIHATWNLLAKKANSSLIFVWYYSVISSLFLSPFIIYILFSSTIELRPSQYLFMFGSGIIHSGYSIMLQKGYKVGDLSLVYPVARGLAPFLVVIVSVIFLKEPLTVQLTIGIFCILVSVFLLSVKNNPIDKSRIKISLLYGFYIAFLIMFYTIVDKIAVSNAEIPPFIFFYGMIICQTTVLSLFVFIRNKPFKHELVGIKKIGISVGVLSPLSYIMILYIFSTYPLTKIAPLREVSILFGILLGVILLKEKLTIKHVLAMLIMFTGVVLIVLG